MGTGTYTRVDGGTPTVACYLCHSLSYPHQESSLGHPHVKGVRFRYAMGAWSLVQVTILRRPVINQLLFH